MMLSRLAHMCAHPGAALGTNCKVSVVRDPEGVWSRAEGPADATPAAEGPCTVFDLVLGLGDPNRHQERCLGYFRRGEGDLRELAWMTARQVGAAVFDASLAVQELSPSRLSPVGVVGPSSPSFLVCALACAAASTPAACLPSAPTSGPQVATLLRGALAGMEAVFVDERCVEMLMPAIKNTGVRRVVVYGAAPDESPTPEEAQRLVSSHRPEVRPACMYLPEGPGEIDVYSLKYLPAGLPGSPKAPRVPFWAKAASEDQDERGGLEGPGPKGDDVFCIIATSGTTGMPKAVPLSHTNIMFAVNSLVEAAEIQGMPFRGDDVYFGFLPLDHIYGLVSALVMLRVSASFASWRGQVRTLLDDARAVRPTYVATVPRVLQRLADGIDAHIRDAGMLSRLLCRGGLALKAKLPFTAPLVNIVLFRKARDVLGGRVRLIVTGGAPCSPQLQARVEGFLGAPVIQGYGLTEACGIACVSVPGSYGNVGPPLPGVQIKLRPVMEMGYLPSSDPPRGEVVIRSPGVFQSYLGEAPGTLPEGAPLEGGWLPTGDVGEMDDDGALTIIDRRKNLFKLSQGEYVAPEMLEATYAESPLVDQIWIYGDSMHRHVLAVVAPNHAELLRAAKDARLGWMKEDISSESTSAEDEHDVLMRHVCGDEKVQDIVLSSMDRVARAAGLRGFEMVEAVHITPYPIETGTSGIKTRRHAMLETYAEVLSAMYVTAGEEPLGPIPRGKPITTD